jgi:hypothetical protein
MERVADREKPTPSDPDAPRGVDLWLVPFFRDSSLWPVLAVAVVIFVVLGAWALLLAVVDRSLFAVGALVLLFWMSVDATIRSRRQGGSRLLVGSIAGFWLLSIAAAVGARSAGWY